MKTVPSKIANFLFRLLTSSSIKDLGCSLKILKKEHLVSLDLNGDMHRFIAPMLEKERLKSYKYLRYINLEQQEKLITDLVE